ncbi:MAG: hypothetical protein J1F31_03015 [Erysipelotrichales bacterium]|nr:hypothetical protein [Erysipelotrichales bacterium]
MMEPIEIIVIIITVLIIGSVIGNYIYRKIKHLPTGECACCQKKGNNLVKQYRKYYQKNKNECNCTK